MVIDTVWLWSATSMLELLVTENWYSVPSSKPEMVISVLSSPIECSSWSKAAELWIFVVVIMKNSVHLSYVCAQRSLMVEGLTTSTVRFCGGGPKSALQDGQMSQTLILRRWVYMSTFYCYCAYACNLKVGYWTVWDANLYTSPLEFGQCGKLKGGEFCITAWGIGSVW